MEGFGLKCQIDNIKVQLNYGEAPQYSIMLEHHTLKRSMQIESPLLLVQSLNNLVRTTLPLVQSAVQTSIRTDVDGCM